MATRKTPRLHPLIAAAAISVITVSAVGVGALTGILPRTSASSAVLSTVPSSTAATPAAKDTAQAGREAVATPSVSTPVPAVAPSTTMPAPNRRKPAAVHTRAPIEERRIEDPVVVRDYGPSPTARTLPPVAAAPNVGTIESVRQIAQPGEGTGLGAVAGGVLGGVIGHQFGGGNGKKILTVVGAAGGAYAGHQVEKQARGTKRWEIDVRMDSGALRTLSSDSAPLWQAGDRVRVVDGRLEAA
ncbi:MAG: glycine zipper 2TM domain-containing protein [bacterium]|jgi:outer membrane lipoprotein SlyB